jgi:acyl-CoA synthetase (NDP forming)
VRERLAAALAGRQIAVQGPNCLGLVNYARRAAMWGITVPLDHAGTERGVALIAQSGNMALTLSGASRGMPLTHLASCGNQLDVTAAELISGCVADPAVRAIAVILEAIPDIGQFQAALADAAARDVPVAVLKVGTSERARQAAAAHTGSLSGPAALHRSFFRQFGAIQVDDLDELAAVAAVMAAPRRPRGRGLAVFASSGGECGLVSDLAQAAGLVLPELPAPVAAGLAALLPAYGHVANPLDLTAGGWGNAALYADVIERLAGVPGVDTIAGIADAPTLGGGPLPEGWDGIISGLCAGAARTGPAGPVVAGLSTIGDLHSDVPRDLAAGGVIPLAGLRPGLTALARAAWYAEWRAGRDGRPAGAPPGPVSEHLAKQVLACYGIAAPVSRLASTAAEAVTAAGQIGYPVAVKMAAAGVQHKTELGGVLLNLGSAKEVSQAASRLLEHGRALDTGAAVLVEQYARGGLELIVGGYRDPAFGPVVMIGLGGVQAELLADVTHRLVPVTAAEAAVMTGELAGRRMLDGFRGRPPVDLPQLARVLAAVSSLLEDHEDISELDINPLAAAGPPGPGALLALDALLVLGEPAGPSRNQPACPPAVYRAAAAASSTGDHHDR